LNLLNKFFKKNFLILVIVVLFISNLILLTILFLHSRKLLFPIKSSNIIKNVDSTYCKKVGTGKISFIKLKNVKLHWNKDLFVTIDTALGKVRPLGNKKILGIILK